MKYYNYTIIHEEDDSVHVIISDGMDSRRVGFISHPDSLQKAINYVAMFAGYGIMKEEYDNVVPFITTDPTKEIA